MHRPVLVTPPADLAVSIEEAMRQCRISADALDPVGLTEVQQLLGAYILAATEHLEGWTGILGRCLKTQVWRQDFDGFARCLPLGLGPVSAIGSVTWLSSEGQVSTVTPGDYALETDGGGRSAVRFRNAWSMPGDLFETAAVSVTYTAGSDSVPVPIQQAILLSVGAWYENREETVVGTNVSSLPASVAMDRLLAPYRRVGL
ncbi:MULTISPECIES: head-tail connector protein [unclassified Ensifer]|uniref:head-tail connector protein n=1 Tax=unclassified Ensifer TaxID=2633371 RepID=UPI0030100AB9